MKSSEIVAVLEGRKSLSYFVEKHHEALYRLNNRNDGAITSSDIDLKFDTAIVIEQKHVDFISRLNPEKSWLLSNLVSLCAFEFISEDIEEYFYNLCER